MRHKNLFKTMPLIPALRRLRQEDCEFQPGLRGETLPQREREREREREGEREIMEQLQMQSMKMRLQI
jgi:hypothetical protein